MKLIHCNVEAFNYFDAFCDFVEQENPDILSLVEASTGRFFGNDSFQRDYIGELTSKFGYNSVFHPTVFRDFGTHSIGFGAAVLSKYPLQIEEKMYFGGEDSSILPHDHIVFSDRPKYERYPYGWRFHLPFLSTFVETPLGRCRILSAHFHVSYECLETLQIWEDAEKVAEFIKTHKEMPTIFTGDCNIRNESMTIKTLASVMEQQSRMFDNTLTPSIHPYFKEFPNNRDRGIDHIFTKKIQVQSCEVRDVAVSDHLPLVLEFSL